MNQAASRERVLKAFNREEPDRIPLDLGSKGSSMGLSAYEELKKRLGVNAPTRILDQRLGLAAMDEEVLERFRIDTRYVYMKGSASWDPRTDTAEDTFFDEWGGKLKRPRDGFYYDHVDSPFKEPSLEAIRRHHWPDPNERSRYEGLREEAKRYYDQGYAVGTYIKGVSETLWILRGMENCYMDMFDNPDFYHALAERTADILSRMVENLFQEVGEYVQWLCITCDLGTQTNLMISPSAYKTFVRPYEGRIFKAVKDNSRAKVAQHSCGAIFPLIPLLIESGVEILNPIQTSARGMDTAKLKKEYGRDICFWGGIDVQKVMTRGSVDDVEREVRRVMADLGPGGGYLCGPSHDIQTLTPPENVVALYETALANI
jgi:uroporphyrinogen decarboxylase